MLNLYTISNKFNYIPLFSYRHILWLHKVIILILLKPYTGIIYFSQQTISQTACFPLHNS